MAREKLDHPPHPGHFSAGLLRDAQAFLTAGEVLARDRSEETFKPTFFLLCHALELGFKSYLAASGLPVYELEKIGHGLERCFDLAANRGYTPSDIRVKYVAMNLDALHQGQAFRYPGNLITAVPKEQELVEVIKIMFDDIRNFVHRAFFNALIEIQDNGIIQQQWEFRTI